MVAAVTPPPETAASGRQANGRFAKGNRGGPGNPFARQTAELRRRLQERVTPETLDSIVDALVEKARQGDVSAAKLVLSYVIGKPEPAPDPDRVDLDELQHYREEAELVR